MASRIRIAIDCMGGDLGLRTSLPAALLAAHRFPNIRITLVGNAADICAHLGDSELAQFDIVHADDIVLMSDKPSVALRKKPQSSMRVAIDLLADAKVDAVVSAGNTGALMAIGCYRLKTLDGIDRPAICSSVPAVNGHCYLLDLGANVDCGAENLYQFAVMGSALATVLDDIPQPRVALLNIGAEQTKGNEQVKNAGSLIEADSTLNYVGHLEGDKLFSSNADVVVCDGFVGNVALKTMEGTASYIADIVEQQFKRTLLTRALALLVAPVLKKIYQQLNPEQYNGASFLGLQGIVVKSHGSSSEQGFVNAIEQARREVSQDLLALIGRRLSKKQTELSYDLKTETL